MIGNSMIRFEDVSTKRLLALAEIFTHMAASMAKKYPNVAQFYRDVIGLLDSEVGSRSVFGVRTCGWIDVDLPSLAALNTVERVVICDYLAEMGEGLSNPAVKTLLDEMVYAWFRDVETG